MPNLAVKTSSVSPCFRPEDPDEPSNRDGNVNACFHPDEPAELTNRDGNVNSCFHPGDGDVNSCFHPDLHFTLTGLEEQHLAVLAAR